MKFWKRNHPTNFILLWEHRMYLMDDSDIMNALEYMSFKLKFTESMQGYMYD